MKDKVNQDIANLCQKYSPLSSEEINYLIDYTKEIQIGEQYSGQDIFIDVWNSIQDEAIVVWHRKPLNTESLYKETVVGKIALKKDEPGPLRTLATGLPSINLYAITQEGTYIKQTSYPIHYRDKVIGVLILEESSVETSKNILDEKTQRKENISNSPSLMNLIDLLSEIVMIFNSEGILIDSNKAARDFYKEIGYMNPINQLHYDNLAIDNSRFKKVKEMEADEILTSEISFWNYFLEKKIFKDRNNQYIQILKDETSRKEVEAVIENELVTVQEIHHRVKNNLQTIVSLLRLQSRRTDSLEAKKVLNESINRVMSIATTHELLSKKNEDIINLKEVIDSIVNNLMYSFSSQRYIRVVTDINENIDLDFDLAVPVALIVNELVQNSLEHAFPENEINIADANITVKATEEDKFIQLRISDNGIGFKFVESDNMNLGLQIVTSFVKSKLNGLIVFESNKPGTLVRINFINTTNE
ncbi:histidine kinase N-terminal domain-containing protein [Fundicoccus culcitae]|uniref:histidine kinase n=1 Tax=Fundicoccus culcitae TaxID=2969821 RepID=A0ABY5P3L2_9LACT|nr:histidine kinase N-terminal domain-containing protein [Fundicoccus culcitae]UUX33324.1 sensor histidine kinase [Fundicoccus culcitae]